MKGQILDIETPGRFLKLFRGFCIIEEKGVEIGRIPLDDLEAVIYHSHDGIISQQILSEFAERAIPLIVCNSKHMPVGIYWSLNGHFQTTLRLNAQSNLSQPKRKQIWQQIVQNKIKNQAKLLKATGQSCLELDRFEKSVKSGDPDNREALAAQIYWPRLLGNTFRRDPDSDDINGLLNYGYAILRASVVRAIVAAGLHPALALHHHNAADPTPLANDLMEPWRPVIDIAVYLLYMQKKDCLTSEEKKILAGTLDWDLWLDKERTPLRLCIQKMCLSFVMVCLGESNSLTIADLPDIKEIQETWSKICES